VEPDISDDPSVQGCKIQWREGAWGKQTLIKGDKGENKDAGENLKKISTN